MKWILAVAFVVTIPTTALSLPTCDYAGQSYSAGATVCECPSLVGEGGLASGGAAKVTSRRLACSAEGWKSADKHVCRPEICHQFRVWPRRPR